jgi:hypothetical protein
MRTGALNDETRRIVSLPVKPFAKNVGKSYILLIDMVIEKGDENGNSRSNKI